MLILKAKKPQYMCVPLKWDTQQPGLLSACDLCSHDRWSFLCVHSLLFPLQFLPQVLLLPYHCLRPVAICTQLSNPHVPLQIWWIPLPISFHTLEWLFFSPAFACFPSVSSLLIGPEAKTFALCLPGLRQATMIAVSSYRWSSLQKRRGLMSTDFFRCLVGQGMLLLLLERAGERIFWISSWPTFLLA